MRSPKNTEENQSEVLQIHAAPRELLELADKVRYILNTYPSDDPAVWAIRHSEAYRMVAHLIEVPSVPWRM